MSVETVSTGQIEACKPKEERKIMRIKKRERKIKKNKSRSIWREGLVMENLSDSLPVGDWAPFFPKAEKRLGTIFANNQQKKK